MGSRNDRRVLGRTEAALRPWALASPRLRLTLLALVEPEERDALIAALMTLHDQQREASLDKRHPVQRPRRNDQQAHPRHPPAPGADRIRHPARSAPLASWDDLSNMAVAEGIAAPSQIKTACLSKSPHMGHTPTG